MAAWTRAACPKDGRRLVLVTATNADGDAIKRWECPAADWAGPWYAGDDSGDSEALPEVSRRVLSTQSLGAGGGAGVDPVSIKDGTVAAQKLAVDATGKIGVNNFPASQPVTGPLTDAQLRAVAVPVSGTVTATGPLTDAQLRAAAVPVSGPLTDAQLRATPVPISGTVTVTDGSGPLTVDGTVEIGATSLAALESITVQNGAGAAAVNIQDGGNSITVDGTVAATQSGAWTVGGTVTANQGTANTAANAWPGKVTDGTNTAAVKAASTAAAAADPSLVVALHPSSPLPAGTNVLGSLALAGGLKPTYSATVNALVPAATPTDVFTITGSATKTVKIHKIQIDATATAAAVIACMLVKRSTANSAGTSTAPTKVALDSTNAAATATVLAYTANPTPGTLVGNIRSEKLFVSTTATQGEALRMEFGDSLGQPIVLRGTGEVLGLNLNSVTLTGGSLNIFVEWTEE